MPSADSLMELRRDTIVDGIQRLPPGQRVGADGLPHYLLGGPAMGRLASGVGMTFSPCRTHGLGGGVTGSGGIDRPLIRGMTTGFFAGREALRNVDVAIGAVGRPGGDERRTHVIDVSEISVFLGLDVGKGEHHATAVTPAGKKAFDKRLPNSEPKLREVFGKLQAKHGTVLVIVDQPASIGALPLAAERTASANGPASWQHSRT